MNSAFSRINLEGLPLVLSDTENKLTVVGCDDFALIIRTLGHNVTSGCISGCSKLTEVVNGSCSGVGCWQTSIPEGSIKFLAEVRSFHNHRDVSNFNPNGYAFVGEQSKYTFNVQDLSDPAFKDKIEKNVPIVADWYVNASETCIEAQRNNSVSGYICQSNANCIDFEGTSPMDTGSMGYRCSCLPGYQGNPYLTPGCTDIDECAGVDKNNECSHICINIPGSYICSCPEGHHGDGLTYGTRCISDPSLTVITRLSIGVGASLGSIILLLVGWWLHSFLKRRQVIKQQQINFEKNGGMLLRQQMSSDETVVERIKIFTINQESQEGEPNSSPTQTPPDMTVIYWNARGIARTSFLKNIRILIHQHNPHMLIISETRTGRNNTTEIVRKLPFDEWVLAEPVGFSGGILVLWDSKSISFEPTKINRQGVHGIIQGSNDSDLWVEDCICSSKSKQSG